MLFGVIVIAFLFQSVVCQSQKTPCCMPERFQATLTDARTVSADVIVMFELAIDYAQGLEGSAVYELNPRTGIKQETYRIVFDVPKHSVFTMAPNGTCWRTPYEVQFPSARERCLPASAQYISGGNMGSIQALPWDSWRVNLGNITVTMAFGAQGCVPVVEGLKITGGPTPYEQTTFWSNFRHEITDHSLFYVPSSCVPSDSQIVVGR
ncbi:hypothetical protein BaRGS_00000827 [Batillaria attramentaria]|uniref:Uncharacterized protein n=1 Tax=Batillaria attramentaria TaxID=370345 RepID=A0ABD0M8J4_9CAEN